VAERSRQQVVSRALDKAGYERIARDGDGGGEDAAEEVRDALSGDEGEERAERGDVDDRPLDLVDRARRACRPDGRKRDPEEHAGDAAEKGERESRRLDPRAEGERQGCRQQEAERDPAPGRRKVAALVVRRQTDGGG